MKYEVELKFPVSNDEKLAALLSTLEARELASVRQVDRYFRHPARDFAQTDEALRIRTSGDQHYLTYKGPKLDQATKTRHEIEIPFDDSTDSLPAMLELLGFQAVLPVSKQRRRFQLMWHEKEVEVALDRVDQLGTFVELEIVTEKAGMDQARETILSLASHCRLGEPERRSYLELLLAQQES